MTYNLPVNFHFDVKFDLPEAVNTDTQFQDVSGLSIELEEETYTEGGENSFIHKFPVRTRYPELVLRRALLVNSAVRQWCEAAIKNLDIEPVTVWVTLLNEVHEPLQTYTFINAWPKKWSISDFNAAGNEIVIESLELAYQYFTIN